MSELQRVPGTRLIREDGKDAAEMLDALFIGGGLVLSQVTDLAGIEGYMVQNWVRRGYLTPSVNKRYSKRQFCRIVLINLLRDSLNIGEITDLISRINGHLDDESDDLVDDAQLYVYFVRLLTICRGGDKNEVRVVARGVVSDFIEPVPGARRSLVEILVIMYLAYNSSLLIKQAKELLGELPAYADISNTSN